MNPTGYRILSSLHTGTNTQILRAQRLSDDEAVVLKILSGPSPSPGLLARLQHEFEIITELTLPKVIQAYSLEHQQDLWIMVLEDFGGTALSLLPLKGQLSYCDFLRLARSIVDAIGQIHAQRIIHKDINPANIVLNQETGQLKLIDFGIATELTRETPTYRSPNLLEGTLPYISPEQTGRMNRAVDYRSDFYSLGVTLYELLTGERPFLGQQALELVHNHIAVQSRPPHQIKPDIPPILSAIILKLMSKNAEDRYQSAAGIQADLERCLTHIDCLSTLNFPLAQCDSSNQFQIPQKFYGRENEIDSLLASFDRVAGFGGDRLQPPVNQVELVLVTGPAGIGKSALVRELYRPVTKGTGYFIGGKFEQLQRNAPYFAFLQAFNSLIQQILTQDDEALADWRKKLLTALGVNGQVIVDVLPDLELIIGPQPDVSTLGLNESQHRFNLTLQRFIAAFAQPKHPLVIYLDDLQWADGASLRLLEELLTTATLPSLLLIGAYRDNEVDNGHPLQMMRNRLAQSGAKISHIGLDSLALPHVSELVADTLRQPHDQVAALATLVTEKTGGNPYFVGEFLKSLYVDSLINFAPATPNVGDESIGKWQWQMDRIRAKRVTENVVDLLSARIHRLPKTTQRVLQLAACLGNLFTLTDLATVHGESRTETATGIRPAILEGYILPLGEHYLLAEKDEEAVGRIQAFYRFAHDRVQQAAYDQIAEEARQTVHRQIGLHLLESYTEDEQDEHLFEIVGQLNRGLKLATGVDERRQLAKLNLRAGVKAKKATAYEIALDYLSIGREMLPPDSWHTKYMLTLTLYNEAAETAHANREFDRSVQLANVILQHARVETDKVRAYEIEIASRISQNEMGAALTVGLKAIGKLGVPLVHEPPQLPPIHDLLHLPAMTDSEKLTAMHIMNRMVVAAFVANPDLLPPLIYTMVNLTLSAGTSQPGAASYSALGAFFLAETGDIEQGYQLGKLSLKLLERDDAMVVRGDAQNTFNTCIRHWKEHARGAIADTPNNIQERLEVGNVDQAVYLAIECCLNLALVGEPLDSVHQQQTDYIALIEKLQHEEGIFYAWVSSQFVQNLRSAQLSNPQELTGARFDAVELLPVLQQTKDYTTLYEVHALNAYLRLSFKKYDEAVAHAQAAEQYARSALGLFVVGTHNFIYSLALLAAHIDVDESTQADYLTQVAANQEKMAQWAHHAPMNFQHKLDLVEAERLRVTGQPWEAAAKYEHAVQGAREHGYLNDEALAHELAAEFFLAHNMETVGQMHLRNAHATYVRWQARSKVVDLEARYSQLANQFLSPNDDNKGVNPIGVSTTLTGPSGSTTTSILDAASILGASQTLSSEINLDQLLIKLMELVIENAGAETGYLLLEKEGRWIIEAQGHVDNTEVAVTQSIAVEQVDFLPQSIINYVARTQQPMVLDDARDDGPFVRDHVIVTRQPRSVLCMPLLNQSNLIAILYLENNLTTGAFTADRLEVLTLLGSQAAISLENAYLYAQQQQAETQAQRRAHFEQSLIEASNELLQHSASIDLYQCILERAVQIIPGAQAGSITRRGEDHRHYFVAAVGYELAEIAKVSFADDETLGPTRDHGRSYLLYNQDKLNQQNLASNEYAIMREFGQAHAIQVTLMVPIRQGRRMVATLMLDNMDERNAFDEEARLMAESFGAQVGVVLQQLALQANLLREEERYRQLVESMNDGLGVVDEESVITFANPPLCEMLGYTATELIGMPVQHLFDKENRRILSQQMERSVAGNNEPYEITYRRKNGLPLYTIISPQPVFDDDKVFRGSVSVITDITDRVLAQQVLEQRVEERTRTLETLLETTRSVVSTLDLEPLLNLILDQLERVVAYSGSVILGLEEEELVVLAYRGPTPQDEALGARYPAGPMLADLNQFDLYKPFIAPDIRQHPVVSSMLRRTLGTRMDSLLRYSRSWMAVPLIVGERMIGLLSVSHLQPDYYTKRQGDLVKAFADQAALALVNAQRYEQAPIDAVDEERNRLARDLHDSVTQALYTANLYTGAAKRALSAGKHENIEEYVQELQATIREATHDMRLLIFELRPPLLEKDGLVAAIRARIEGVEARSGIDVQFTADDVRLPIVIEAELYRVVQEALNNIVKHAQAQAVTIHLRIDATNCALDVRDNGRGFDLENAGGDGHIGLTGMAERVQKLGGKLTLESEPGQGTTIHVDVPID